jgi:hemerythrin
MAFITWKPEMSVGIAELDQQHQRFVEILNRFHERMKVGRGSEILDQVLADLVSYAENHFGTEERLFDRYGYPDAPTHRTAHADFLTKMRALQSEVAAGKRFVSLTTLNLLRDWLDDHVMTVDMAYKEFFARRLRPDDDG